MHKGTKKEESENENAVGKEKRNWYLDGFETLGNSHCSVVALYPKH